MTDSTQRGCTCAVTIAVRKARTVREGCARRGRKAARMTAAVVLCVSLVLTLASSPAFAEVLDTDVLYGQTLAERGLSTSQSPDITAEAALVIGQDGTVYFERNADESRKIASLTKIMTAIVALENASLDLTVEVSAYAASVGESTANLMEGDTMTLELALYGLLIPSGNDAATAIAESVGAILADDGQDAFEAFIEAMNAKAVEIGCTDTVFTNPHGLDDGQFESDAHSTARDVAIMVAYAMEMEDFRTVVAQGSTTITVTSADGSSRNLELTATNELMGTYEGLIGVKTGNTALAGPSFAAACVRDDLEIYTVVLGAAENEDRFSDTATLLDWVYDNLDTVSLINTPSTVDYGGGSEEYPLVAEVAHTDWPNTTVLATVSDPDLAARIFFLQGVVSQEVTYQELQGDIEAGDVVGTISFILDGVTVAETDLIAVEDVSAPDTFESFGVWWDRLFRRLQGQQTVAESICYNRMALLFDR